MFRSPSCDAGRAGRVPSNHARKQEPERFRETALTPGRTCSCTTGARRLDGGRDTTERNQRVTETSAPPLR